MTPGVFKEYLDMIFVSLKGKPFGKNNKLSPQDEALLLDVCNIVKYNVNKSKNKSKNKNKNGNDINDYNKAFNQNILPVIQNWLSNKRNNETSPYLLRQVLYYVCCTAYRDGIKAYQQTALVNKISKVWKISQNVWNKWEMYPKRLYKTLNDPQVDSLITYMGEKTKEIGLGVRYLAFQAGNYSNFIDLFGGSGFASVSVIHNQGTKYFYNELCDDHIRNYVEVLSDPELFKKYKEVIKDLKDGLRNRDFSKGYFRNIDLIKSGYNKYSHKTFDKEFEKNDLEYYVENYDALCKTDIPFVSDFYRKKKEISYALGVWCYFQSLQKDDNNTISQDKVLYAVATTFLYSVAVRGTISSNAEIVNMFKQNNLGRKYKKAYRTFISEDDKKFNEKANCIHKRLKGEVILNMDALTLLKPNTKLPLKQYKDWQNNNILYYADPPYMATKGYKEEFTPENMQSLIENLLESGQKFIFSCRASTSAEKNVNGKDEKYREEKIKANNDIYNFVFEKFNERKKDLYVTAIIKGNITKNEPEEYFKKYIRENRGTEIYITNYKVRDFYSVQYKKYYLVLTYKDFMDLENEYLMRK